jgi:hypothetical protein
VLRRLKEEETAEEEKGGGFPDTEAAMSKGEATHEASVAPGGPQTTT